MPEQLELVWKKALDSRTLMQFKCQWLHIGPFWTNHDQETKFSNHLEYDMIKTRPRKKTRCKFNAIYFTFNHIEFY
ncbi:uncharacterized protein ASCRUDRAFT_77390 [Ascoidea rubescens DSM 1968]|uniref:Uncharacterized protein n=1 Tax=Ascoidea rubescens DSM 1968 TaxID=1344418 RepID=A0A1D2VBF7_9ASCO|nr:hypothetical protein ASCRUDRAFT_77390 [Ascoidea rubescens DSM 1968]ODV58956.1 hypothetical protein ASCRUDRAFT_77390 [Ascoidea rubescens DSM 1968]